MIQNKARATKPIRLPLFTRGDLGGITYIVTNNIVNYLVIIATLSGVLGWPDEIVFGRVIPGISVGIFVGCIYYAYMAQKLANKIGSASVTALPSGIDTPSMFVILYGVVMPLHFALKDPMLAWSAAVAACFIGGLVEFGGGIIGPWMKRNIPRAALLGTVAGIGFIWMATQGLFDILADPVVGLPILAVSFLGLFGGYVFPKRLPPFVLAVLGGIIYAYALGRTHFDFTGVGFYLPNPVSTFEYLINGAVIVVPYLTIIIPIEVYNFIGTMDNVEAANAAGDDYSVREAQFADGACTMISALFGGVVPNTVWLGHAGLKKSEACIGYSLISGVILLLAGLFGLFTFLSSLVPPAICGITYLWCALLMVAQAYRDCDRRYAAAICVACVPPVADFLFSQVTGAMSLASIYPEVGANGMLDFTPKVVGNLVNAGVLWHGVPAVKSGAIIIGLIFGSFAAFVIDRRLLAAAACMLAGAIFSLFGLIHSAALGFYPASPFVIAYCVVFCVILLCYTGRNSWFRPLDKFDYL